MTGTFEATLAFLAPRVSYFAAVRVYRSKAPVQHSEMFLPVYGVSLVYASAYFDVVKGVLLQGLPVKRRYDLLEIASRYVERTALLKPFLGALVLERSKPVRLRAVRKPIEQEKVQLLTFASKGTGCCLS